MLPPCLLICFVFCMDLKMFIGLFNTIFEEKSGNCNQLKCISTGYVLNNYCPSVMHSIICLDYTWFWAHIKGIHLPV